MAIQVQVPSLGESITQATLLHWHKADGDPVRIDEPLCELESDKANVDIPSPAAGVLHRIKQEGETVRIGEVIASIDETAASKPAPSAPPTADIPSPAQSSSAPIDIAETTKASDELSPAVRRLIAENKLDPAAIHGSGIGGRLTKEDVQKHLEEHAPLAPASRPRIIGDYPHAPPRSAQPAAPAAIEPLPHAHITPPDHPASVTAPPPVTTTPSPVTIDFDKEGVRRVPMSKIRRRIAERLVTAQQTAAILTTFNEVDMTAVLDLRARFKDRFAEVYGVSLGLMSFFAHASVLALKEFPNINAYLEEDDIVYHQYVHLGIAVSTDRGLAVPVLRHVETMSFAKIESEIKRLAAAVRDGKLNVDELSGGTFTITNGGIYGSLLSTPILNPPQSGILGMHAIQKRPVAINDKVEIRPMMYVALSYDHRIVDGRESVSFLVRLKQLLEDPTRLMLEI